MLEVCMVHKTRRWDFFSYSCKFMKIGGYGSNNQNIPPYFLFYIYSVGEKKLLTGRESINERPLL